MKYKWETTYTSGASHIQDVSEHCNSRLPTPVEFDNPLLHHKRQIARTNPLIANQNPVRNCCAEDVVGRRRRMWCGASYQVHFLGSGNQM